MTTPGPTSAAELAAFSPVARAWFADAFATPTPSQVGAWQAIATGGHTLVVAPTGSGKTLAAFLWALDQIASTARPDDKTKRCRVLYVSPMKALAVDVERNLRAPLAGLRQTAGRLGLPVPDITVGVRSGDTPADERRRLVTRPPDVLITTPESLFLMLTSQARETLRGVDTVIVDEVHAVAGTKRGAHLAVSLERLDELLERPAQRIGLSATVRPIDEVARFLGGAAPPPSSRRRRASSGSSRSSYPSRTCPTSRPVAHDRRSRADERALPTTTTSVVRGARARLHLAPRRGAHRRPGRAAPLDDRVRQLAAARGAADGPAQRDHRRATRRAARRRSAPPARDHGAERRRQGHAWPARPGPPRLGQQGAAGDHRGRAEGRSAALRRRHLEPRARHRHGRGRPGDPGRVPAVGGQRPAARRARRPPGRRGLPRRAVPQAPRRPGPDRGHRRADAVRPDRGAPGADEPARRARPADRGLRRPRRAGRPTRCSRWYGGRHRSRRCRGRRSTRPSTCWPGATRPTSSPSCGRGWSGTGWPTP